MIALLAVNAAIGALLFVAGKRLGHWSFLVAAVAPAIAVRVQDLYGTTVHPAVARGRVPLVVHLLSPAGRPVQVTSDLPGFWTGSWKEVRKDMAGRYPKHDWPLDPSTASPSRPGRGR